MKKIIKTCSLALIILAFITACHKEDTGDPNLVPLGDKTGVCGCIYQYGSGLRVPGAMIILYENRYEAPFGPDWLYPIDTFYTDRLGCFDHTFSHEDDTKAQNGNRILISYYIEIRADNYFSSNRQWIKKGYKTLSHDFTIDPKAWIRVHVKNVNPFDEWDNISTRIANGGGGIRWH